MCLKIDYNKHERNNEKPGKPFRPYYSPIKLDRPLSVYKLGRASNDWRSFRSPYRYFQYPVGVIQRSRHFGPRRDTKVRQGFHAYATLEEALYIQSRRYDPDGAPMDLRMAVIPAGSRVFYGRDGDVVADTMMLTNLDPND